MREWIERVAAMLAVLLLGAPATAQAVGAGASSAAAARPALRAPRPAIWLVEDGDTKIYLFGTVHAFPETLQWRSPALERVIAEADELVMETPDASLSEAVDPERLTRPMQMGKTVPILERVSPNARAPLRAALAATGLPLAYYDGLHTWAVAFTLSGYQIAAAAQEGEDGEPVRASGAEEVLGGIFRRTKRPVSGVETIEQQIGVFANMPIGAQRRFLESMVVDGGDPATPSGPEVDEAWAAGDVEAVAAEMGTMPRELYEALLTRRNRAWTEWLAARLERPGTLLFAVGAGHLAGPESVQAMLAERGIQARRID